MSDEIRQRFRDLHRDGLFVMPNPWDIGSAKLLASLGFTALATTSSGHAASLGRPDRHVTLDELVEHATALAQAIDVPLNVDAEYCFAEDTAGIADTVERLADTGAAGFSLEDFNPIAKRIDPIGRATERVGAAAAAARRHGLVLTARAENHICGIQDLDDTIRRLVAYRDAGADVLYAPGLTAIDDIERVASAVGIPVNVLLLAKGPSIAELVMAGVRRVSTGGALARAAYGGLRQAATELFESASIVGRVPKP
ncbi:MAG: isocitrate lyase/PEP mutase family protein [Vicinamibacteraceae bacterium]